MALDESMEARLELHLEAAVAHACAADPWLRDHPVTVEWWGGQFASGRTDPDAPSCRLRAEAQRSNHWAEPRHVRGSLRIRPALLTGSGDSDRSVRTRRHRGARTLPMNTWLSTTRHLA